MTTYPIWSGVGGFVGRLISLFPIYWMCVIWLNMDIFSWIFVMKMLLSLQYVMTWTLLHFSVSCWIDISSRMFWTVFGSFMPILRIQKLVLFIGGKSLFHELLFVELEIYDMLWCSHYCATIPRVVPLGVKSTWTSNISYLVKGWSERSMYNVLRV